MRRMNVAQLNSLLPMTSAPCVSVYIPLAFGPQIAKRVLKHCEHQLLSSYSRQLTRDFLQPIEDLVLQVVEERREGTLCVFKALDSHHDIEGYTITSEELIGEAHVAPRFYLKPLLDTLQGQKSFYVLVMSDEGAELVHGNPMEYHVVWSSGPRLFTSNRTEEQALDYLEKVGVETYLLENSFAQQLSAYAEISVKISRIMKENEPFFLCASKKAATQFRLVANHSNLMPGLISPHIVGNVNGNYRQIFLQGLRLAEPYWQNQQYDLLAHIVQQKASDKLILDIEKILELLETDRLSTLFIAKDKHLWGQVNLQSSSAQIFEFKKEVQVQDLASILANKAMALGKRVFLVESKWLEGAAVAALRAEMVESADLIPLNRIWFNPKGQLLDVRK